MIHVDEAWFYLIRNKEEVHVPGREDGFHEGAAKESHPQRDIHLLHVVPEPSRNFDGKIGIR